VKNFSIFEQALNFSDAASIENLGEIASLARRDFFGRESFMCHTTTCLSRVRLPDNRKCDFAAHESFGSRVRRC
jgi:hypothetical protein